MVIFWWEEAATKWLLLSIFSFFFSPSHPIQPSASLLKEEILVGNFKENTNVFTFLAYFIQVVKKEVSNIKLEYRSIFLKSVLKLYFKHFYLKLFNSCLYKENPLCPGILKCMC